jgi:hypothetical protein
MMVVNDTSREHWESMTPMTSPDASYSPESEKESLFIRCKEARVDVGINLRT